MAYLGFIGTGNMGGALAQAAVKNVEPKEILLSNKTAQKAERLAQQLGCRAVDNPVSYTHLDGRLSQSGEHEIFAAQHDAGCHCRRRDWKHSGLSGGRGSDFKRHCPVVHRPRQRLSAGEQAEMDGLFFGSGMVSEICDFGG